MANLTGEMLGQYRLIEKIGEGGMGVVWKARDTSLDRDVAIKVLPAEFAGDAERMARFEREAKAVAALSHPNIVAIYGFGATAGVAYAAIELLEGRTLREHIDEGRVPPRKTIEIARQIASGLDAAHAKGIVHRDLKPDNVFITPDGRARILDFGLAAVVTGERSAGDDTAPDLATRTELTNPGAVMGTVGYMSPEQVRAAPADSRSDIFALGTMLHEMLSGERPFKRPTAAETMTAILREDPPEIVLGDRAVPPALARVIRRCMEKSPDERFQNARDLAFALENATLDSGTSLSGAGSEVSSLAAGKVAATPVRMRPATLVASVLLAAVAFSAGWLLRPEPAPVEPPRVTQLTFTGSDHQPNVSPDNSLIAFTSGRTGISQIWLRQVVGGGEQPLTEGPDWKPHFSPDGTSIAFIRDAGDNYSAYRVPVVGGQPRRLIDNVSDVEWSPDGRRMVFIREANTFEIGGKSTLGILDLESGTERILSEHEGWGLLGLSWSPDGRRIAVTRASAVGAARGWRLLLVDLDSSAVEEIDLGGDGTLISAPTWAGSSALLVASLASSVTGTSAPGRILRYDLATKQARVLLWAPYLFPPRGSLIATTRLGLIGSDSIVFDSFNQVQTLHEIELSGGAIRPLTHAVSIDRQPSYSPDGSKILFTSNRSGNIDLFSYEFETGRLLQLTDHPASDWDGGYTPDGTSILWGSDRTGTLEVWIADADGANPRQVTHDGITAENPTMTPDGEWIVFSSGHLDSIGIMRIRSDGTDLEQLDSGLRTTPDVSPDGRFVLYVKRDGSRLRNRVNVLEIASGTVVPFEIAIDYNPRSPNVAFGRGRWMPDGKAIAYLGLDEQGRTGIWVQDFRPGEDTTHTRRPLAGFRDDLVAESFDISPDGKRLILSSIRQIRSINLAEGLPEL